MLKILIIEDEKVTRDLLKFSLAANSYEVVCANDGLVGYKEIKKDKFDLIISDVVMPEMDGFELLQKIREDGIKTPFIMLTAIASDEKQISAFNLNVEDYFLKPFNIEIVIAKINQIMTRIYGVVDDVTLDKKTKTLMVYGEKIELTTKEYAIFNTLYKNKNEWVTKEVLFKAAWKLEKEINLRSVDFTVKRVRKKLGIHSNLIVTKRGIGYKYEA